MSSIIPLPHVLTIFLTLLCHLSPVSGGGISEQAVPSLVLLGTAKGGTTDLWHMLHRLHKGFCTFPASAQLPSALNSFSSFPEHIQTRKELDFFSSSVDSMCRKSNHNSNKRSGGLPQTGYCSRDDMTSLLRCPNSLLSQWKGEEAVHCKQWLQKNDIKASRFTATASPSLMYEFVSAARALGQLNPAEQSPLFVMLLRHPVSRITSLYNHWHQQELHTGNGYALDLEALVELELQLLHQEEPQKYLKIIAESVESRSNLRRMQSSLANLRKYMEVELEKVSHGPLGRVNLRSFGLVLDGFYALQLLGWMSVSKKSRNMNSEEPQSIDIRNRLLIVKSEYMFNDRESFMYDILLPFLHPSQNSSSHLPSTTRKYSDDGVSVIVQRDSNHAEKQKVQNQKKDKHKSSLLSSLMSEKLMKFYSCVSLENLLFALQKSRKATVVPTLDSGHTSWW